MNKEEIISKDDQVVNEIRTLWHPLCYRLMRSLLVPIKASVQDEQPASNDVPRRDMILRHEGEQWTEEQRAFLPDGIRDRHLQHHQLELKITESLSDKGFKQAFMYDFLYPQKESVADHEFQTYIVCSKTPQKKRLTRWGYKRAEYPGVYISTLPVFEDVIVLVLNRLRNLPHNNYFQLFASEKKVRESAFEYVLQTHSSDMPDDLVTKDILNIVFALSTAYNLEIEGVKMEHKMTVDRLLEMGDGLRRNLIAGASLEERLYGLKPEERVKGLSPEELFTMFTPEARLMGLKPEERVMGLKPEERFTIFSPKERLAGLSSEGKRLLMNELQRSLQAEESEEDVAITETESSEIDAIDTVTNDIVTNDIDANE